MSRTAVYEIIKNDLYLNTVYGITADRVFPSNSMDSPPRDGYFIVFVFEEETMAKIVRPVQFLSVWAHRNRETSTDYANIAGILNRIKELLTGTIHYAASDGSVLVGADFTGMGRDLIDEGYNTITKVASFEIRTKTL